MRIYVIEILRSFVPTLPADTFSFTGLFEMIFGQGKRAPGFAFCQHLVVGRIRCGRRLFEWRSVDQYARYGCLGCAGVLRTFICLGNRSGNMTQHRGVFWMLLLSLAVNLLIIGGFAGLAIANKAIATAAVCCEQWFRYAI